ncbi:MAG: alanine--tRNA ligase [Acidimicrobiia bacterium]
MDSYQIRNHFTSFFEERDHVVRPSASLIPIDPTLLLTNAGMVPFKPYFLGEEPPPYPRAVTVQKVVRTVDIDIIGTTQRHLSFFEMLGNFSFGDYFKESAIPWAYEFVTDRLGLDPDRLWYTVFLDDDEAADIWVESVGVDPSRLQRRDEKDNFWQMGVPGPCGPSSEIFYDKGPEFGEDGGPAHGDEDRFVEIWNLVFMQNLQDRPYHVVGDLPAKNIDTGMGLDRVAAILQGVPSVFEIDTIKHIRDEASSYTGLEYGADPLHDVSLRILADHARSVTFLIGDGVIPSNDGRGHILRRLLRRAVRHAWQYGGQDLVFPRLVEATIAAMGDWYTDLIDKHDFITQVVTREEERFRRTLESGHQLLDLELEEGSTLSGSTAFKLHDTFGFPIELTREIAEERGVEVDSEGFEAEMAEQRRRARAAWKGGDEVAALDVYRSVLDVTGLTDFVGYEVDRARGQVLAIVAEGETIDRADEGREVEVFLSRTPFYGESGGQVGDTGTIETETGKAEVLDTQHALQGLHGHKLRVKSGFISVGQDAEAVIDSPRRDAIRKSHTGTHVLHWGLRDVLGDHAGQAGSLVEPGRIRFDFSHFSQMSPEEIGEVEAEVNRRLIDDAPVTTTITSKEEAKQMGALAFFGDKYGETVRVVKVGDFSTEFCGGTHTHASGQVGPLLIMGESSIGSNLRRVEALTGMAAYRELAELRRTLDTTGELLKAGNADVPDRVRGLLDRVSTLEKELETVHTRQRADLAAELAGSASAIGDLSLVVAAVPDLDSNGLRQLALGIRDRLGPTSAIIVGSRHDTKGALVGVLTKDLVERGASAAEIISGAARALGGGGSKDPELAQAGGPNGASLEAAMDLAREDAERLLGSL